MMRLLIKLSVVGNQLRRRRQTNKLTLRGTSLFQIETLLSAGEVLSEDIK